MKRRNGGRGQMRKQREGAGMLDLVWLRNPKYYRDSKFSCSRLEKYFDPKYSSAGRIRAFSARLIFWRVVFSFFRKILLARPFFMGDRNDSKK